MTTQKGNNNKQYNKPNKTKNYFPTERNGSDDEQPNK